MTSESGPGEITSADLGAYTIATTQVIDTRFAMAFAAAVNDTNPAYFDDLRQPVAVHPGIVFTLQWASRFRPDHPVNLRAAPFGVHASTDLRIYRPFRVGEAVTTQGRLIAKRQVPPGVYVVDRYRMTGSDGTLIAELDYNGITRGATLVDAGGSVDDEPMLPDVGPASAAEPLWHVNVPVPLHAGQQYTECARIYNPIHTEPSVARAAGLPGVILHGSATKAMSLTAVVDKCFDGDAARVTRLCGQMRGMVLLDTEIRVEALAQTVVAGEKRILFRTLNADGAPAIANGIVCGRV